VVSSSCAVGERYTGVAQMFPRDKVNVAMMAYFVACVCGV
jgi:hypothetical protein